MSTNQKKMNSVNTETMKFQGLVSVSSIKVTESVKLQEVVDFFFKKNIRL